MHFIKADGQPSGHQGRAYYQASYHHDDGLNWCAIVDDVRVGEIEISEADFVAQSQANFDFNLSYEAEQETPRDTSSWVRPAAAIVAATEAALEEARSQATAGLDTGARVEERSR